jgi:hypothetical protein
MILFKKHTFAKSMDKAILFECRLQLNLGVKIACSPNIPLCIEVGMLFITLSFEILKIKKSWT